jgi:hypothetical protein
MTVTQQTRQSQLFAAEDWRVIYTAFTQVNFAAYDFNTIRSAMVDYIRINYPENYNDWIESSEFVALIDLLAYLGQSLAFRIDLNTRENFLDTATRRESVFRLARMLSYQPRRSYPANGKIKITSVVTNQPVVDSMGRNLQNVKILWNDQNNADWFEQFIIVLNASLSSTNTFGTPVKSGTVQGYTTELYSMNNTAIPTSTVPFTASVAGNSVNFELVNVDFNPGTVNNVLNSGSFYEIDPDPLNAWSIIYQNDGNGYASANTGFFFYFKQGSIGFSDYQCSVPLANRVIDVNANNVNETDVWVQTVDTNGIPAVKWTKVPSVNGFNVVYNSLENNVRNIFSVITRDSAGSDQISIRFSDGNFGNIPTGIIRVWYRTGNNLTYQIRPNDIQSQVFAFNYLDNLNNTWSIAFTTDLQYTITNAQSSEDNTQIAQNAPQVYYTQDRMVNGEDYNLFPLQNGQALKVKAVNRFYSGQSRYLDSLDPTGNYSDLNVFGTDGILYSENDLNMRDIQNSPGINLVVTVNTQIQPLINGNLNSETQALELKNFFYYNYPSVNVTPGYTWKNIVSYTKSTSGAFFSGGVAVAVGSSASPNTSLVYFTQDSLITFQSGKTASIVGIVGNGTGVNQTGQISSGAGAVTLSNLIDTNDVPVSVIPSFRTTLTQDEISMIAAAMAAHQTFGIRYDQNDGMWKIITPDNLSTSSTFSLQFAGNTTSTNKDASWLLKVVWVGTGWRVYSRALRYIFESVSQNRFYFNNTQKIFDPTTNTAQLDYINILGVNADPITGFPLGKDYLWEITGQQIYPDGYSDPRTVRLTMWEGQNFGIPDNPNEYNQIVNPSLTADKLLFWQLVTGSDGYQYWNPYIIPLDRIYTNSNMVPPASDPNWHEGEVAYVINQSIFYQWTNGSLIDVSSTFKMRIGRNNLNFLWKHFASSTQRINPAITNVIDMYVLTTGYDTDLRNWIATNGLPENQPQPPSSADLNSTFGSLEQYKMMTDQMIWHPVSYKVIFGNQAAPEYQVIFKVVKTAGTTVTDNEVKSLVIATINNYFALSNWDFGQSFYFTELAAYIHQQLATIVASVVITPLNAQAKFGDLFEIQCTADEIFISGARVTDVQIVQSLTETVLGISNG